MSAGSGSLEAWPSPEVAAYLRTVFERAFGRGRDAFSRSIPFQKAEAARRGGPIPTDDDFLMMDRRAGALMAFPALAEEAIALIQAGKIPTTSAGVQFSRALFDQLRSEIPGPDPGDTVRRASIRAYADVRDYVAATALPVVRTEDRLVKELERISTSAAASYRQALDDLNAERLSYRGTANELRQTLWDVLQILAPDELVTQAGWYKQEPETKGPTHRQRARFILQNRHKDAAAETALAAIDLIAALARGAYTRSNESTHSSRDRDEALQVQRYVDVVLRDLLL